MREENESVYWREKLADGQWYWNNFLMGNPNPNFDDPVPQGGGCNNGGCHGIAEDLTFTINILRRFKLTGVSENTPCATVGGNTPCDPSEYD